MGLLQSVEPFFSPAVRGRGDNYFESGAVGFVDRQEGMATFEVDGSSGHFYEVVFYWDERLSAKQALDSIEFECACPHFDDGHCCKHLWAAARLLEELEVLGPRSVTSSSKSPAGPASSLPDWQKQLGRHQRLLAEPADVSSIDSKNGLCRVFYLLEVIAGNGSPTISLFQQQKKKNGEWGVTKPLRVSHGTYQSLNAPEDHAALGLLLGSHVESSPLDYLNLYDTYSKGFVTTNPTKIQLSEPLYSTVLPALCETGRFVWLLSSDEDMAEARPLAWDSGKPWQFRLHTKPFDRKRKWRVHGELLQGKTVRPLSDAVHCFSSGLVLWEDQLARLEKPRDFRWLETLRENKELIVPTKEREAFLSELWRSGEPPEIIGEASLRLPGETGVPTGRLIIHPPEVEDKFRYRQVPRFLYATVGYRYEGYEASPGGHQDTWLSNEEDRIIRRNFEAEEKLLNRLGDLKLEPKAVSRYGDTPPGHLQLLPRKLNDVVETLVDEGWVVEAEGARVRKGGAMSVSIRSGIDWFDLEGQIDFDGVEASLPDLLAALRGGERYVKLGDGSRGLLPEAWLSQYAPLAELASEQEGDALRFQPSQALLLDSMLAIRDADNNLQVDRQFSALRKRLRSFQGVEPMPAPREFKGELRDYQKEGLGWLRFLEKFSFGGCLADDMGLGKTIQVLALLANRWRRQPKDAERRPSLIVVPKSLIYNWQLEAERFAPRLAVANYTGTDRHERIEDFTDHDLVLTTYGTLRKDIERLSEQSWDYTILDEAQAIKNPASQSAKASRLLMARHRLALSGTPVENHLGELWSIFEFLNPGMLGKSKSLRRLTKGGSPDEGKEKVAERLTSLRKGLAPFLLRRTKQEVLPQLPKKTEQPLYCDLPPAQRKQYNQLRDHYRKSLNQKIAKSGMDKSKIHVLEALLRLRQAACHPGLIDEKHQNKPSAKLDLLVDQLTEIVGEGHKALVFSQFTTMLGIVKSRLDKAGLVYEYLDGKTSNRQKRVERFQTDEDCPLFLISLKAGGTGLNLTAADYVFILDPWWNPAVEAQAIDRTHRLGQSRPVFAYRLIARDTVEEKIIELQDKKRDLADAIISSDSSLLKSLTADDLQALLS